MKAPPARTDGLQCEKRLRARRHPGHLSTANLGAHQASPDTYRPEFVLPAILLGHALLRALNQDLDRPDHEEDEA